MIIEFSQEEVQVLASVIFVKELLSDYAPILSPCLEYLIPAVLKTSISANEDIKEESYNCLNMIANNMLFITAYGALAAVILESSKKEIIQNAMQTMRSLLYNWEIQDFLETVYQDYVLFTTFIFDIYNKYNDVGFAMLKMIHDKIGQENFDILCKLSKEIEDTFELIMNVKKTHIVKTQKSINA